MKKNIGLLTMSCVFVIGIGIAIGGIIFESYWGLIGVVILATAVFSFCPLYALLGIKTTA